MASVFVLTVDNHGEFDDCVGNVHTSVHSTKEKAMEYLADYCSANWIEQGNDEDLSENTEECIQEYFEYWDEEMSYDISEMEIDPTE